MQSNLNQSAPLSSLDSVIRPLLCLAALFHDLGKMNLQFQSKLRNGAITTEWLRHELVSHFMLQHWIELQGDAWLQVLSEQPQALASMVQGPAIQVSEDALHLARERNPRRDVPARLARQAVVAVTENPVAGALCWLVLTHHENIGIDADEKQRRKTLPALLQPALRAQMGERAEPDPRNLQVAGNARLPWTDPLWLAQVQTHARELLDALAAQPSLRSALGSPGGCWARLIACHARPVLVYADFLASASSEIDAAASPDRLYANTRQDEPPGGTLTRHTKGATRRMADSLVTHLLKTGTFVQRVLDAQASALPGIRLDLGGAHRLLDPLRAVPRQFQWQNDAVAALKAIGNVQARPLFCIVISGTGAGKTLAAPKLLAAAGGDSLRYTVGLGLKSLTLQTGEAYQSLVGLRREQTMTVVGDTVYAQLRQSASADLREQKAARDDAELAGSHSVLAAQDDVVLTNEGYRPAVLAHRLGVDEAIARSVFRGEKALSMTEVPVLSCTTDHLVQASVLDDATDARMSLRLATADLVLDEIDAYGYEDLQALARLCHAAGVHGRRVVVMSATVSRTVLKALYAQWWAGYQAFLCRGPAQAPQNAGLPVLALVSNYLDCSVTPVPSADEAAARIDQYVHEACAALKRLPARNCLGVLPLGADEGKSHEALYRQALLLSRQHRSVEEGTGRSLSCGFVRFNRVRDARRFARLVFEKAAAEDAFVLRVQCYHARFPVYHLTLIEEALGRLLHRADEQAIFKLPEVRRLMDEHPAQKDFVLVVSTTSIQETGRDHDYDWCVLEPWSTRSLVQAAGRVLRHRDRSASTPNVWLLEQTLASLEAGERRDLELCHETLRRRRDSEAETFARLLSQVPLREKGLLDETLRKLLEKYAAAFALAPDARDPRQLLLRSHWLGAPAYAQGITAAACLSEDECGQALLSRLEHFAQGRRMGATLEGSLMGVANLARPWTKAGSLRRADGVEQPGLTQLHGLDERHELLWGRHAREIVFRRRERDRQATFALDPATGFQTIRLVVQRSRSEVALLPRGNEPHAPDGDPLGAIAAPGLGWVPLDDLAPSGAEQRLLSAGITSSTGRKLSHAFDCPLGPGGQAKLLTAALNYEPLLGCEGLLS